MYQFYIGFSPNIPIGIINKYIKYYVSQVMTLSTAGATILNVLFLNLLF